LQGQPSLLRYLPHALRDVVEGLGEPALLLREAQQVPLTEPLRPPLEVAHRPPRRSLGAPDARRIEGLRRRDAGFPVLALLLRSIPGRLGVRPLVACEPGLVGCLLVLAVLLWTTAVPLSDFPARHTLDLVPFGRPRKHASTLGDGGKRRWLSCV